MTMRSWRIWVWASVLLGMFVPGILTSCRQVLAPPRQGWNRSYGPVVPHDKFPADCSLCHTGGDWTTIRRDFTFDHEKQTGVPLHGAHQNVACLMCHNDRGPAGEYAAKGCAGCHEDVHRGRQGRMCSDCHIEMTWQPIAQIAKHNRTRFPLVGAHASVACFRCHPGAQVANFEGADTACAPCHQADFSRATSPNHGEQGWTSNCQNCHTTISFKPALLRHNPAFPLAGGHAGLDCTRCHIGGQLFPLPTACVNCHLNDYQHTTDPNHVAAGIGTDCASCHSISTWKGARFPNHPAVFPLTGGHAGRDCTDCHKGGIFMLTPTDCVSCHLKDYQRTTRPNHTAMGFGTDCTACHSTTQWKGAKFTHPAAFPLTGGHGGLSCADCHKGGVYGGLSTACESCHLPDFKKTSNPNHLAAGFGTTCSTCHRSTTTWAGAVFNHVAFPITSGPHKLDCNQCHTSPANMAQFSCTSCHAHAQTQMKSDHKKVRGYAWSSPLCYQCHPQGRSD